MSVFRKTFSSLDLFLNVKAINQYPTIVQRKKKIMSWNIDQR